ncbi:hypothetical protein DINM_006328 [Dirofilaria immitis]|nr:hypothetical protein [Dirofilaria immitis]
MSVPELSQTKAFCLRNYENSLILRKIVDDIAPMNFKSSTMKLRDENHNAYTNGRSVEEITFLLFLSADSFSGRNDINKVKRARNTRNHEILYLLKCSEVPEGQLTVEIKFSAELIVINTQTLDKATAVSSKLCNVEKKASSNFDHEGDGTKLESGTISSLISLCK